MSSKEIELAWLVKKTHRDADLLRRAETYFIERHYLWSSGVIASFQDLLERKRDQLHYEHSRIEKLGWQIASGRDSHKSDI